MGRSWCKFLLVAMLFVSTSCKKVSEGEAPSLDAQSGYLELTTPGLDSLSGLSVLSLSSLNSVNSKVNSNIQMMSVSTGDYGLSLPTTLPEITCFAVAVDLPDVASNGKSCDKSNGQKFAPGLFVGLYKAGTLATIKVPAGSNRKVYLLGFAATSSDACVDLKLKALPSAQLSPPVILGEVQTDIVRGGKSTVTISPSLVGADSLATCDTEVFNPEPPTDPAPIPVVPITPPPAPALAPKTNPVSCATPGVSGAATGNFACYGVWDFEDAFGNDQALCAATGKTAYEKSAIGCEVNTTACASGIAVASKVLNVYRPWDSTTDDVDLASDSDITQIASRLQTTEAIVRSNLIRVWEYTCKATPPAELTFDKEFLDFGSMSNYSTISKTVTVTNLSNKSIVFVEAGVYSYSGYFSFLGGNIIDPNFSYCGSPFAPGASCTIAIEYLACGVDSGQFYLNYQDLDGSNYSTISLPLSGWRTGGSLCP